MILSFVAKAPATTTALRYRSSTCFCVFFMPMRVVLRLCYGARRNGWKMTPARLFYPLMVTLAASLNMALFVGMTGSAVHRDLALLLAAMAANQFAAVSRLRVRNGVGSVGLAASLVAVIQLAMIAMLWGFGVSGADGHMEARIIAEAASLAGGAGLASIVPVVVLLADSLQSPSS